MSCAGWTRSETGTYRYAGHEDRYRFFLAIGMHLILFHLIDR